MYVLYLHGRQAIFDFLPFFVNWESLKKLLLFVLWILKRISRVQTSLGVKIQAYDFSYTLINTFFHNEYDCHLQSNWLISSAIFFSL